MGLQIGTDYVWRENDGCELNENEGQDGVESSSSI